MQLFYCSYDQTLFNSPSLAKLPRLFEAMELARALRFEDYWCYTMLRGQINLLDRLNSEIRTGLLNQA